MTTSLRTSRTFKGSPISIRALCGLEDRSLPLSVLDIVRTDGVRHFGGQLQNGDVDCTWNMSLWQNGFWSVTVDFHDGGVLAGDFFFAEFLLGGADPFGVKLEGSLLNLIETRHLSLSKQGSDKRVRESWNAFEASGPRVRLHAAISVGGIALGGLAVLAATVVFIFSGAGAAFADRVGASRCDDQDQHGPACIHYSIGGPSDQ